MSAITAQHKAIRQFYADRKALGKQGVTHELAVREPFKKLLETLGKANRWTLVVEQKIEGRVRRAVPDGTLRDDIRYPRGYWEAKDTRDDLDAEIQKKFARGYPKTNIIFEDTRRAVLYQRGERAGDYDLNQPEQIATLLERFFGYTEPNIVGFEQAMATFQQHTPELARGLLALIEEAHKDNRAFQTAYAEFMDICKNALNPNISREAVDEMLIQHLLTERLMRTVFDNPDFAQRNAIAVEVEKVIKALTSRSFSRRDFLGQLDYFYEAIEAAARDLTDFKDKQTFINTVYERFFQGYAVKVADTHGIVYTPQPIVDFMCAAVEEVLRDEFGLGLDDPDVCIIDPCTGTGNFILNLMRRLNERNPAALPDLYAQRMFANEVMLLPYYIASLNIEHAYYEMTGRYEPFEGLCFVDTLDLAEGAQMKLAFMTERNSERVERQKQAKITVVIGNPPYNVGQLNENDNNKNRKYDVIDKRVAETYVKDSQATLRMQLYDPYVKFFRWATDRLEGRDGIVCYVSNNSFVDQIAFDGMRQHLLEDFTRIYHLDLHGNVRQNPKLSGTTHNVFGIQVGVGITVAVRSSHHADRRLFYHRVPEFWRKEEKLGYLEEMVEVKGRENSLNTVEWRELRPDAHGTWIVSAHSDEFEAFLSIGRKESRTREKRVAGTIFHRYSMGPKTNADAYVYDFGKRELVKRAQVIVNDYRAKLGRWLVEGQPTRVDEFLKIDETVHKWIRNTKRSLLRGTKVEFDIERIRKGLYRPFNARYYYFEDVFSEDTYRLPNMLPTASTEEENCLLCCSGIGGLSPFKSLVTNRIPGHDTLEKTQCFPFYVYDEDGSNRRENITDWALAQFRAAYGDETITKWDIFYYVYGLLHHPAYRARYADNLKRELPRIPLAGVEVQTDRSPIEAFRAFAEAGRQLAELHLGYEDVEPYSLEKVWKPGKPISWRVEQMRLSKDKTAIQVNDSLTLRGIPAAAFDYRLGNRSALDWIIDQYRVKTDKRSGITSDPNRYSEDEQYIVKLVGRVARVSVDTVAIVKGLPELRFGEGEG
ncbi:MAG: N-6 DNA methylase [Anaerolineae bacterium]|nr:N-6 DNA methylase [Anaerolineae bacterium]